ncbi:MAG: type III pantothenate kinase [Polyangiaceae bacterium]|nr:type III pantothenate kinase [Polyangiaceae bacterium]
MLLVVDIGNTNVVCGLYQDRALCHAFRASTRTGGTSDEYAVMLRQMMDLHGVRSGSIDAAIVASVVPPVTDALVGAIRQGFHTDPLIVGPGLKTGISVLYDNPRDVGADRIVNAVAAYDRVHAGVIVVDFGTATTFDCISPQGEYLGGVIVPGVQLSLDALLVRAARLTRVELAEPPRVVGRNTTHALQSGVVHGYCSLVDGLVQKLKRELGFPCEVIATGGLAQLIAKHSTTVGSVDINLTLEGLRLLYERNARSECGSVRPRGERTP